MFLHLSLNHTVHGVGGWGVGYGMAGSRSLPGRLGMPGPKSILEDMSGHRSLLGGSGYTWSQVPSGGVERYTPLYFTI